MAGKTPRQAVENFLAPIQRAVGCISSTDQIHTSGYDPAQRHALAVNGGRPVVVTLADDRKVEFGVSVQQNYRVVESAEDERGPWKVQTTQYVYSLHDTDDSEILSYHWHPGIGPRYPHLHVKATPRTDLRKAHLPTARISLEEFLRTLIVDFRIRPRRSNWKKILTETQTKFMRYRTWG